MRAISKDSESLPFIHLPRTVPSALANTSPSNSPASTNCAKSPVKEDFKSVLQSGHDVRTRLKLFLNDTAEQIKSGFQSALSQKFEEQGFKPLLDPLLMPEWESKNTPGVSVNSMIKRAIS